MSVSLFLENRNFFTEASEISDTWYKHDKKKHLHFPSIKVALDLCIKGLATRHDFKYFTENRSMVRTIYLTVFKNLFSAKKHFHLWQDFNNVSHIRADRNRSVALCLDTRKCAIKL